jgi:hypothetical protein
MITGGEDKREDSIVQVEEELQSQFHPSSGLETDGVDERETQDPDWLVIARFTLASIACICILAAVCLDVRFKVV